jgi:hypothetical protein
MVVTNARKKILMTTVVWGDWYISALVEHTLPSLLSPHNFPYLAGHVDLEYIIMTQPAEQARIEISRAIQLARRIMTVHVVPGLPGVIDSSVNVFNFHHAMWRFVHERARNERSYVLNLPPDAVFADGAGKSWADLLGRGAKSILWMFPRAVDTVMPILRERYLTPEGIMVVPPRDLVKLNIDHLHPLSKAYFADSTRFPNHPEMAIWPVGDEGFLLRAFAGEARLFDPSTVNLSPQQLVDGNLDGCAFIDDSDAMYMLSLTPVAHNADWYNEAAEITPAKLGRWWLDYNATSGDLAASRQIRIHTGRRTEALWRGRERWANLLVSRAVASREFYRVSNLAFAADCSWVAALATMVARTRACLRLFPRRMPRMVFGPTDAAIGHLHLADLLRPGAAARLRKLLYSHVAVDERPDLTMAEHVVQAGGTLRLRSLAGRTLTVQARPDGTLTLNGFKLGPRESWMGDTTFIPVGGFLDDELAQAPAGEHGQAAYAQR